MALTRAFQEEKKAQAVSEAKKDHNELPPNHTLQDLVDAAAAVSAAQEQPVDEVQLVKSVRSQKSSSQPAPSRQASMLEFQVEMDKDAVDMAVSLVVQ